MKSQVIVPLDGSTNAEAILPHALFFAQQTQSVLTLLRVIMPPGEPEFTVPYIPDDWYDGEVSWTKNYLTSLASRLQAQGVLVQIQHLETLLANDTPHRMGIMPRPDLANEVPMPASQSWSDVSCHEAFASGRHRCVPG